MFALYLWLSVEHAPVFVAATYKPADSQYAFGVQQSENKEIKK